MSVSERRAGDLLASLSALLRTTRVLAQRDQGHAMTGTLAGVLTLAAARPVRPGDIATHLMVTASVASRAVAALEADGLVERHADPDDARACLVGLTDLGRTRLAQRQSYGARRLVEALPDWDDAEAAAANQVLRRLELSLAVAPDLHPLPAPKVLAGSTAIALLDLEHATV